MGGYTHCHSTRSSTEEPWVDKIGRLPFDNNIVKLFHLTTFNLALGFGNVEDIPKFLIDINFSVNNFYTHVTSGFYNILLEL